MALTPAEQAQLAALMSKANEPDDDQLDEIEDQLDEIEDQLDEIEAVETAETIAEQTAEPEVIVVEVEPEVDPAAVIDAQTRHDVAIIDAEVDAAIRLREHEADMAERNAPEPSELLDAALGEPLLVAPADTIPRSVHPWFRKWTR